MPGSGACQLLTDRKELERSASGRKTPRYGFIDAIRGIAACSVMLQHSLYQSGLLGNVASNKFDGFIPNWLELGETGVVAFFLVSGFVIPLSLEKTADFKLFWTHRALRIYPLYITVFFVTFALQRGGSIHSISAFAANFISHLLFVQEYLKQEGFVGGAWTLSLEMVWYIAISGLFLVSLNKKTNLIVSLSIAVSVLSAMVCGFGHHLPMGRLSMLLCCVFGFVCYRRDQTEISQRHFAGLSLALGFTIVFNLFIGFRVFPGENPSASFAEVIDSWALAASIFFVPFFMRKAGIWDRSVFSFLGRISYSVYLIHGVVLYLLFLVPLNGILLVVVTFASTIGISFLTYKFIEAPPIRFGHSLKARFRSTPDATTVRAPSL
jgi:peptidoglycan/LPS O-acetylase OafA/YrhL